MKKKKAPRLTRNQQQQLHTFNLFGMVCNSIGLANFYPIPEFMLEPEKGKDNDQARNRRRRKVAQR